MRPARSRRPDISNPFVNPCPLPSPHVLGAVAALVVLAAVEAPAQTCFWYVDNIEAVPGIQCVQKSDLSSPCSWPTDCTSIPSSTPQTLLAMHTAWHNCFGNVGGGSPPAGRGQRWYAFHRQFEFDFNLWRDDNLFDRIESVEWCPPQDTDGDGIDDTYTVLQWGHGGAGLAAGTHVSGCGEGDARPPDNDCHGCEAFPQCLFSAGGGPIGCPTAPSASCSRGGVSFPHTSLDQFDNVDDVSRLMDAYFHGDMHSAVSDGDEGDWGSSFNNDDCNNPVCSPRDPMFWRLHKALDDVIRAWQDGKAVDVMMVVDKSGSMSGSDASGGTKLDAALDAVDYFADLLEHNRPDGQINRIGIVTYSNSASLELALAPADASLRDAGGPFASALNAIRSAGPGGCTAIGAGIEEALLELCPNGGDCRLNAVPAPTGTNQRKAILLLTDGLENQSPCLQPAGATGSGCGSRCFGAQLDYDNLDVTQLVAIGFGGESSLNGELLELLAERQAGIYVQNPGGSTDDLKYFYTMAFGQLTDEFVFVDPKGTLDPGDAVTPAIEYTSCGDEPKITYTSGWLKEVRKGELRLLVTSPSGALVRAVAPAVESSTEARWAFSRFQLPYRGESGGAWRGHLIRPHRAFVNGFAPDAFDDLEAGTTLVRRQIQRLCPDGCKTALLYEQGLRTDDSVYEAAVARVRDSGLVGSVTRASSRDEFAELLERQEWDLVVYANMDRDREERYDQKLADLVCRGQRAIITDARDRAGARLLKCAGTARDGTTNWMVLEGDGRLLDGSVKLRNPGYSSATYGLALGTGVQATADAASTGAVFARARIGEKVDWFVDVLGRGLGKLHPVTMDMSWHTADALRPSARILPSNVRAGGYDHVEAWVEVEYPTVGVGTLLARQKRPGTLNARGETVDGRAAALARVTIPTQRKKFRMYDDGTHGDVTAGNAQWTTTVQGIEAVDGTYRFRYIFDLTSGGCTTRREANHSIDVAVRVDPEATEIDVQDAIALDDGGVRTTVRVTPADAFGNLLGPGAAGSITSEPGDASEVERVVDQWDGSYLVTLRSKQGVPGVRLNGFGTPLDIAVPCQDCNQLERLKVYPLTTVEHGKAQGVVKVTGPPVKRASRGTVVFLESSDPALVKVPDYVELKAGELLAPFRIEIGHTHEGRSNATVTARLGGEKRSSTISVRPPKVHSTDAEAKDRPERDDHGHGH